MTRTKICLSINSSFWIWTRGGFCDRAAKCTPLSSFLPAPAPRMVFELASFITFTMYFYQNKLWQTIRPLSIFAHCTIGSLGVCGATWSKLTLSRRHNGWRRFLQDHHPPLHIQLGFQVPTTTITTVLSAGDDQFGCTTSLCSASYRCVSGHIVLCHLCGHTQGLDDCNM